jgi:hypothetical protein
MSNCLRSANSLPVKHYYLTFRSKRSSKLMILKELSRDKRGLSSSGVKMISSDSRLFLRYNNRSKSWKVNPLTKKGKS